MNAQEMKRRTKELALAGIKLISEFPQTIAGKIIANQLVRSATSVGATIELSAEPNQKLISFPN